MDVLEKLRVLADAAKYDVSCSSSGSNRPGNGKTLGNAALPGICHSFADDGRCISLLKILFTNKCIYDCAYCVNRRTNDAIERAEFTPDELVDLMIQFYRRNYIEGLFLSSGVVRSPNHTMELLIQVVKRLRNVEKFNGYIHLKGIPGADPHLIEEAGKFVDRLSVNIELPTAGSLRLLAPEKKRIDMIQPMQLIKEKSEEYTALKRQFSSAPLFVPAGQTTQLIIGATAEPDYSILKISEAFYNRLAMKRVYYSAYVPVGNVPMTLYDRGLTLQREHRIYQADWLLRFYGFKADEIVSKDAPNLDLAVDPKCHWALRHLAYFPVEVMKADLSMLLRVPGIGNVSARRIIKARRFGKLSYDSLKQLGVVLKRARYFITCSGKAYDTIDLDPSVLRPKLLDAPKQQQVTLFDLYPNVF